MTRRAPTCFIFAMFLIGGCHPLPPGRVDALRAVPTSPRAGHAYLIRGWRDLWSQGIDQLAAEIRDAGVPAEVYRDAQWHDLADALARQPANLVPHEPLALIGFSYGADDVVEIARQLHAANLPVDLLITIDPVTPSPVPPNVATCYNFYQTNGVWDAFPWLRGIPLKSDAPARLVNVDLRRQRPDLLEPNTAHSNIAANEKLHRAILEKVLATCVPRAISHTSTRPAVERMNPKHGLKN